MALHEGVRFLVAPGVTRAATAADEPYLIKLDAVLRAALDEVEHLSPEELDEVERNECRPRRRNRARTR